jgi:hypothetical protein
MEAIGSRKSNANATTPWVNRLLIISMFLVENAVC